VDTELIVTVDIGVGRTAKAISAGSRHTCVILDDDSLKCFGYGGYGALGYGTLSNIGNNESPSELPSLQFGALRTVQSVACGGAFTCVILDNSKLLA
jgi:alpha-tubulin suppressor-like RCC1 family protein